MSEEEEIRQLVAQAFDALNTDHRRYGRVLTEECRAALRDADLSGLASLLEAETRKHCRELTKQVAQMRAALGKAKKPGRPKGVLDPAEVLKLVRDEGRQITAVAKQFRISRSTVYRLLEKAELGGGTE